jgi:hypothetical protein
MATFAGPMVRNPPPSSRESTNFRFLFAPLRAPWQIVSPPTGAIGLGPASSRKVKNIGSSASPCRFSMRSLDVRGVECNRWSSKLAEASRCSLPSSVISGLRPSTTCSTSHSSVGAEHLIKAYVGVTTKVRVVESGPLERSQGKAKRVLERFCDRRRTNFDNVALVPLH